MPEFQLGMSELAKRLGATVVGEPLTEEVAITIQVTTHGLMMYSPENGPTFFKTRQLAPDTAVAPPPAPGFLQIHDIAGQLPRANWGNLSVRSFDLITLIAVHWDGLAPDNKYVGYDPIQHYIGEANYHIGKDWGGGSYGHGIMYHYKIDRSGNVYQVRALQDIVWAEMGANNEGVAICLDAGITNGGAAVDATAGQLTSLKLLVDDLFNHRPDLPHLTAGKVWGHGELTQYGNQTECPGAKIKKFVATLR